MENNDNDDNPCKALTYKLEAYKLMIYQKPSEGVAVYTQDMYYWDGSLDFTDPNMIDRIFEYPDDDLSNPIVDVFIDTLSYNKVDLYFAH